MKKPESLHISVEAGSAHRTELCGAEFKGSCCGDCPGRGVAVERTGEGLKGLKVYNMLVECLCSCHRSMGRQRAQV